MDNKFNNKGEITYEYKIANSGLNFTDKYKIANSG